MYKVLRVVSSLSLSEVIYRHFKCCLCLLCVKFS